MKTTILMGLLALLTISCGRNNNDSQTNVNSSTISQRVRSLETQLRCFGSTRRTSVGFVASIRNKNTRPELHFTRKVRTVSLSNLNRVQGVYIGATQYNDIVVVKELSAGTAEVLIRMCADATYVRDITRFEPFQYSTSNVTTCNFNQITALNMFVVTRWGQEQEPLITTSACEADFNQQQGF